MTSGRERPSEAHAESKVSETRGGSTGGARTALQRVYDELEKLEAEDRELDRRIEAQEAENARLEERLAILSRPLGEGKPWRWYHSLLLIMVCSGAIWGFFWYQDRAQERAQRARMATFHRFPKLSHPHLLVTTRPSGAKVLVNGKAMGFAPIFHPFTDGEAKRHLMVDVEAPGFKPRRVEVTIGRHKGAHVHVALVRRETTGAGTRRGKGGAPTKLRTGALRHRWSPPASMRSSLLPTPPPPTSMSVRLGSLRSLLERTRASSARVRASHAPKRSR